ncbi:PAS domain-containing protein [Jannaschia sp. R86511]|uniref:PAS domain-containing protein n=1 Tax=Jannaschia sp. R86511 TaxID=3093853 RepID=UPI0036D25907
MSDPAVPMVRPRRSALLPPTGAADVAPGARPAVTAELPGPVPAAAPADLVLPTTASAAPGVAAMVSALGQGVLLHDSVGRLTDVDATAAAVLGLAAADLLGRTWHDPSWSAVREDGRPLAGHEHPVMQVLADGRTRHGAVVGLGTSGGVRWLRFDVALLEQPDGPPVVGALVGDVTREVHAGYAMAVESVRSRRLLAPERDVLLRVSRWGRVVGAGQAVEDVLGRTVDEAVGCSVVEFVSPADRPAVKARLESLAYDETAVLQVRVRRRGGERRWTRLGMRWVDPDMSEAHVVLADEHDAVVAAGEAGELRSRLRTVSLLAHDTVALHGADGTYTWVSDRCALDLGWEPEDLLGRPLHSLVHPEDVARVDAAHSAAAAGDTVQVRYRFRGADDVHRLVETSLSGTLESTTGRLVELRSATRPAEELLRGERRLDVAEELLRRCVDQSPVGTVVLGPDRSWRRVNDALLRVLGHARGSLLRRHHDELLVGASRSDVLAGIDAVAGGQRDVWQGPAEYAGADGTGVEVQLGVSAVRTAEHELVDLVLHVQPRAGAGGAPLPAGRAAGVDELTGMSPADLAVDRLVNALQRSTRTGRSVGVVWIVLDGLDDVVAQHGQAAGDSVLVEVSSRLRRTLRLGDTLARAGDDAFVGVFEDVHELEMSRVAARAGGCVDVQAPGTPRGRVTASVGSAARPCSGTEDPEEVAEELLAAADAAARQVRLRGGAGWHHSKHTFR